MKTQNKTFKTLISAVLLINLFIPNFAFAEEATPDAGGDTTVTQNNPVEASPATDPTSTEPSTEVSPNSETTTLINQSETIEPTESQPTEQNQTETKVEEIVEHSETEKSEEQIVTETPENTETKTELTEITETQEETTVSEFTALAAPAPQSVPSNLLTIRINESIVYRDSYTPGTKPITVTDNTGVTHSISPNTALAMVIEADTKSEAFAITDLAYYSAFDSFIINCITVNSVASCYNWQYTVDDVYPFVGIDDTVLADNSEVYLYFGEQNRFTITDDTVALNEPVIVHAEKYDYKNNLWTFRPGVTVGATVTNPADPWTPLVVTSTKANEYGEAQLYLTATGTIQIGIAEDYYYPTLPVTARLAETTITINIQTPSGEFFKQSVPVVSCPNTQNGSTYTLNAWCAVEQTGVANNWTVSGNWFGSEIFLDKINESSSDFANNKFWSWYHNLNAGETGLNNYLLNQGEEILLTYGINPIKITVSEQYPMVNEKITVTISEQDFSDWNIFPAPWKTLTSTSTLYVNGEAIEISNGTYELTIANDQPYILSASKTGYAPSNIVRVTGEFGTREENTESNSTGGGSSPTAPSTLTFNTSAAAEYLYSQQKASGAIGSAAFYTDWAAIALGTLGNSEAKTNVITYLKTDPNPGSTATDYERRAMALLALGINPYSDTKTNYIAKIIGTFDGTQFGDAGLVNDDIFALFPLLKAGYSTSDPEIQKSVVFILSKQNSAGGWESPDMTAASIQALSQVKSLAGVEDALAKAKNYLKLSTKTDGRIGDNSFATSWGLQALYALGESPASWNGSNTSPIQYLTNQQQNDGGVDPTTASADNRVWSTSYALPAAQGRTWTSILNNVSKPTVAVPTVPVGIETPTSTLVTPTTTINFVTTTPEVVTTTSEILPPVPGIIVPIEINPISLPVIISESAPVQNSNPITNNTPRTLITTQPSGSKEVPTEPTVTTAGEQLTVPSANPEQSETKRLLQGAATVAGTAGAYLAWRFFASLA